MQKKLIALAIAGLSSAAFAQSNVVVYGVADVGVESVTIGNQPNEMGNKTRVVSNSSYLGFKGEEDLGNGLKALFQLETALSLGTNADTNGGTNGTTAAAQWGATRDSFVGLGGGFGTIKLGTLTGPYRVLSTTYTYAPGSSGVAYTGAMFGTIGGIKTGTDDRTSNAIAYTSPTVNGFNASLLYAAAGNRNVDNQAVSVNGKEWQIGLNYAIGGLSLGYAHVTRTDVQVSALAAGLGVVATPYGDELKANRIAAKYDFGQGTSVIALWDKQKYENGKAVATPSVERSAWMIGAGHQFGRNQVTFEYARSNKLELSTGDVANSDAKQYTLAYNYDLSKRTKVRTYFTKIDNQSAAAFNFYNNPVVGSTGGDPRSIGASLRHSF
ncbi:porin [Denitratisoma sp. DHT3]|uniref:porin n=1 Tax=Denitratisoma sp. DHT3 TaxID=1981880 RepID=UPI00164464DA|nr:porin [Denitratisoma sp. DHT3]